MEVPSSALFVAADEPLLVFSSASNALEYLEAIDVESGVYSAAYGPNGEPYCISANGDLVFVERADRPQAPEDLRHLLLKYLEAVGRLPIKSTPLGELVGMVWALAGGAANGS